MVIQIPYVIADTSMLVNFLAIARMDLIKNHPGLFLITEHVRDEVSYHYPDQYARLQEAISEGIVKEVRVDQLSELETFALLPKQLGLGERSAIAVAIHRVYILAIDDKKAKREALKLAPSLQVINSQEILCELIKLGCLTIEEADAIKDVWSRCYRFRLKIKSFLEILESS